MDESNEKRGCTIPAHVSLVWPGKGREYFCLIHGDKAVGIAGILGYTPHMLDLQPVTIAIMDQMDDWPSCCSKDEIKIEEEEAD